MSPRDFFANGKNPVRGFCCRLSREHQLTRVITRGPIERRSPKTFYSVRWNVCPTGNRDKMEIPPRNFCLTVLSRSGIDKIQMKIFYLSSNSIKREPLIPDDITSLFALYICLILSPYSIILIYPSNLWFYVFFKFLGIFITPYSGSKKYFITSFSKNL